MVRGETGARRKEEGEEGGGEGERVVILGDCCCLWKTRRGEGEGLGEEVEEVVGVVFLICFGGVGFVVVVVALLLPGWVRGEMEEGDKEEEVV